MRRLLACLSLMLLAIAVSFAASPEPLQGRWTGAIELPGVKLDITVVMRGPDDALGGTIDIPLQNAKGLKLVRFALDKDQLSFAIDAVPGDPTFTGALDEAHRKLSGKLLQAGQTFPFEISWQGAADAQKSTADLLNGFDAWVEASLATWKVPGAAVAIVRDGQVVLAKGFGQRDIAAKLPVTERTMMPIGSSTKAFTATVVGTLVEQGKLEWDQPVREFLPGFHLKNEATDRWITPADLLSHVSGLPRHDLSWYGSPATRAELFERLRYFESNASLRERWQYNNLMFLAAGVLAEQLSGSSWEQLVRDRIFTPLGIEQANFSVEQLKTDPERALGYRERDDQLEVMPYRVIDAMGPAGSINTNVVELGKWLRLQLSDGAVDGKRVLQSGTLDRLHTPRAVVVRDLTSPEVPYTMYALGWFVSPYRGHDLIHHGGNIDGFSAEVAFMPRDRIGVVVLTNKNGSPLPQLIALRAFDHLLELEPSPMAQRLKAQSDAAKAAAETGKQASLGERKPKTSPSHPLPDYGGEYREAGYGSAELTVDGKKLRLKANGIETTLDHWHYDVFRAESGDVEGMMLQFLTNLRGDIDGFELVIEPEVAPIRYQRVPPAEMSDAAFLQQFVGEYDLVGQTITIALSGSQLVLQMSGQPDVKLLPYRGTEFDADGLRGYSVRFVVENGKVAELKLLQPEGVYTAKRK